MHRGPWKIVARSLSLTAIVAVLALMATPAMACDTPCCGVGSPWAFVGWTNTPYYALQTNHYAASQIATNRCTKTWSQVSSQVTPANGWYVEIKQSLSSPYVWRYRCSACIHGAAPYFVGDLVTQAPLNHKVAIDNVIGSTGGVVVDSELVMPVDDGPQVGMGSHYRVGYVVDDARLEALVDAVTGEVTLPDSE